jgi:hypothetical protein
MNDKYHSIDMYPIGIHIDSLHIGITVKKKAILRAKNIPGRYSRWILDPTLLHLVVRSAVDVNKAHIS